MHYATLHTVFDAVKAIHEMTSTRLNGGVYRDEFGNVINDEQLFDVINEKAFLALGDIQDLKMQIEELAHYHEQGLISLSVMNAKTENFIDPQGINKEPSSHKA